MKRGLLEQLSFGAYGGELAFEGDKEKDLVEKEGNRIPTEGNLMLTNVRIQNSFIHSTRDIAMNEPEKKVPSLKELTV